MIYFSGNEKLTVSNFVIDIKDNQLVSPQKKEVFAVTGMACAACAVSVESLIASMPGVLEASVNYASSQVQVTYKPSVVSPSDFLKSVESAGYSLIIDEEDLNEKLAGLEMDHFHALRRKLIVAAVFTLPVFLLSMFHHIHFAHKNWVLLALSLPVVIFSGSGFYVNAFKQARNRMVNMDTLVALSTGIAFIFSLFNTVLPNIFQRSGLQPQVYFESATVIIAFILAGKFLEENSKSKAAGVIRKLMSIQPKTLTIIRKDAEEELPLQMVVPGDKVMVKPGDRIPVDGHIESGYAYIDESMISGEPIPVFKTTLDKVFSGTLNTNGNLIISAAKTGKNTLLAGIIAMVQEAQSSKPPIQKLADKIASVFVPVVLLIAVVTFAAWVFSGVQPALTYAFVTTISVLIIACPCALGLATPTALIVGIGRGATMGILIRNASSLETACKINAVVFDKTGTLSTGRPKVVQNKWLKQDDLLKQILFTIEKHSGHPLSSAITEHLGSQQLLTMSGFEEIPGKGLKANFEKIDCLVGNKRLMEDNNVIIPEGTAGENSVFFACNGKLTAFFSIEDTLRESAQEAIKNLKKEGIKVFMLTGDQEAAAKATAEKSGIQSYFSGVLPADKHKFILKLREQGYKVAMVGDGINDAVALTESDLGIAMATGSDIALDSAGIILMKGDLRAVAQAIRLSKATVSIIRQNFFWAFIYNIVAIPIAAGALYSLTGFLLNHMIAGAAMAMSSVTVVLNSLRLRKIRL